MNFRIEQKEDFIVVGYKENLNTVNGGENFEQISRMWSELDNERMQKLVSKSNWSVDGFLGVSDDNGGSSFNYMIATTTDTSDSDGLALVKIPSATWSVFECVGAIPESMMEMKGMIQTEWLPNSGYRQADIPRIEVYPNGNMGSKDYRSEIWIPIQKI
ncbi:GyrI-like domain-containing protein [Lacrimispora brassicae]